MANPEDKEMKKQWITVDGRQTPIILPQIWDHDKEEWIVTGTNNPLPTQVTGSIEEVDITDAFQNVPAGTTEIYRVPYDIIDGNFAKGIIIFRKDDGRVKGIGVEPRTLALSNVGTALETKVFESDGSTIGKSSIFDIEGRSIIVRITASDDGDFKALGVALMLMR